MKATNEILSHDSLEELFTEQLDSWELAQSNYESLKNVSVRDILVDNFPCRIQFNPARITSSAARLIPHRSSPANAFFAKRTGRRYKGLKFIYDHRNGASDELSVLINPFPIFPKHLTIVSVEHRGSAHPFQCAGNV